MKINDPIALPSVRQAPATVAVLTAGEQVCRDAVPAKAKAMPVVRDVEGEWLEGRARSFASTLHPPFRGQTHRGDYTDDVPSVRRAISMYLFHAQPSLGMREYALDAYA